MSRRMNQDLNEGQDGLITAKTLADLRGLVWKRAGKEGDFADLAVEAGVSKATIQNLMFMDNQGRQTKRPHFETVARLAKALDRFDLVEKIFFGDHKPIPAGRKSAKK